MSSSSFHDSASLPMQQQPLRKRLRRSTNVIDHHDDESMADCSPTVDCGTRTAAPVGTPAGRDDSQHDTLGSLLSPAEALSRKRRTPGSDDIFDDRAGSGGDSGCAGGKPGAVGGPAMSRRRQSRTPEGARECRAEKRLAKAQELAATEANYVRILHVIVRVVRDEVGQLLPPKAVELIFNGLEPIYELHTGIEADLRAALGGWDGASTTVGSAFASRAELLSQLYPPFVNFFDQAKEEIARWEKRCPRFRAYLRQCQARPECLRQSLADLLIRPVQRLPSVTLILADLLKYTSESSPDYACLQRALATVRSALDHINEEKRTTDLRVALFDVMNEVENFPPFLLSAHRSIVDRFDVVEVGTSGTGICRPGANLTLFLLTDYLLIAKRRPSHSLSSAVGSASYHHHGNNSNSHRSPRPVPSKPLRHLELLSLNSVRAVHDIRGCGGGDPLEDRRGLFAIECQLGDAGDESPPYQFCFALIPDSAAAAAAAADDSAAAAAAAVSDKTGLLRAICEQVGRVTCCAANPLDLLVSPSDPARFPLDLAGVFDRQNVLSAKARRFGRRVVTRVLSNRTPRRTLSRALLSSAAAAAAAAAASTNAGGGKVPSSPTVTRKSSAAGSIVLDGDRTMEDAQQPPFPAAQQDAASMAGAIPCDQQQQQTPLIFKKPDVTARPKSRPSRMSVMSSVCRGFVSLRHSVTGKQALQPLQPLSSQQHQRLKKGGDSERSTSSLASLASASGCLLNAAAADLADPDEEPVDVDDAEEEEEDDEDGAPGRRPGGHHMTTRHASSATLASLEQLSKCAAASSAAHPVVPGRHLPHQLCQPAAAAASSGSRFSIGGNSSAVSSAKRFRKHLSSWSLFKAKSTD